ncbi:hypothetical protein ACHAXS_000159 [Conticribra weissflogii]
MLFHSSCCSSRRPVPSIGIPLTTCTRQFGPEKSKHHILRPIGMRMQFHSAAK